MCVCVRKGRSVGEGIKEKYIHYSNITKALTRGRFLIILITMAMRMRMRMRMLMVMMYIYIYIYMYIYISIYI